VRSKAAARAIVVSDGAESVSARIEAGKLRISRKPDWLRSA